MRMSACARDLSVSGRVSRAFRRQGDLCAAPAGFVAGKLVSAEHQMAVEQIPEPSDIVRVSGPRRRISLGPLRPPADPVWKTCLAGKTSCPMSLKRRRCRVVRWPRSATGSGLNDLTGLKPAPHVNSSHSPSIAEFVRSLPLDEAPDKYRAKLEKAVKRWIKNWSRALGPQLLAAGLSRPGGPCLTPTPKATPMSRAAILGAMSCFWSLCPTGRAAGANGLAAGQRNADA